MLPGYTARIKIKAALLIICIFALPAAVSAADSAVVEKPAVILGNILEWKFPSGIGDDIFIEGIFPLNDTFVLNGGLSTDAGMNDAGIYILLGAEGLFDFLSFRLSCIYSSFHSDNLGELTALGTGLLYNDFIELEVGAGWKHLFNYTDIRQSIGYLQPAYRLEIIYINIDPLTMSAQFGNFDNFSLESISFFSYSLINSFRIGDSFRIHLDLNIHNPGGWAFSSYYSGMDIVVYGEYSFES